MDRQESKAPVGPIPRGMEVLIKKAAVDAQFKALLLERRAKAAKEIGLDLLASETAMLNGIPRAQLEAIIANMRVEPRLRSALLGRAAAVMLVALGAAGCDVVLGPPLGTAGHQARRPATMNRITSLRTGVEKFKEHVGRYPTTEEGLTALRAAPEGVTGWQGPYVGKGEIMDAWDRPFVYRCPGRQDETGYDLLSLGGDGQEGTDDDVTRGSELREEQ
jgi:general secretion pathway protein G